MKLLACSLVISKIKAYYTSFIALRKMFEFQILVAQWLERLTGDQKVAALIYVVKMTDTVIRHECIA